MIKIIEYDAKGVVKIEFENGTSVYTTWDELKDLCQRLQKMR